MDLSSSVLGSLEVEWIDGDPDFSSGAHVVDFWSPSCSPCVEKVAEMNSIQEAYPVDVAAVHSPEFGFQDLEHAKREAERHGMEYRLGHEPGVRRRSRQFLVVDGNVRAQAGNPGELEDRISRELGVENRNLAGEVPGFRMEHLGSRHCRGVNNGENFSGEKSFSLPSSLVKNRVYLEGRWRQTPEYLEAVDGRLYLHTDSDRLDVVADPCGSVKDIGVQVDGSKPAENRGEDLDNEGYSRLNRPGLRRLVDGEAREIVLDPDPGLRLYRLNLLGI